MMNKVVVLNETFLRDKHLNKLQKLVEVEMYAGTESLEEAQKRLKGADIAVIDSFVLPLGEEFFRSCSHLDLVVINSTGYDKVDLQAAGKYGVQVANTPDFSSDSVAELNVALIFSLARKLLILDSKFRENPAKPDCDPFNPQMSPLFGVEIAGKILGTIGFGNIGKSLAKKAKALGMKVLASSRTSQKSEIATFVDLQTLLKESDFVTINTPLTPQTKGMIGQEELEMMKESAYLINTARAGIVDSIALTQALQKGKIAGAGLEVIEALPPEHPLLRLENVVFSWHSGSLTQEASKKNLPDIVVQTIIAFVNGRPINLLT